jgi:guanylate kinase
MSKLLFWVGSSCSGKTTAEEIILQKGLANRLLSCTTRSSRPGEVDGVNYNFLSLEDFEKENCVNIIKISDTWFYGIQPCEIEKAKNSSKHTIYSLINMEFAANMIKHLKETNSSLEYFLVYFNIDTDIRVNLMKARGENDEAIQTRLAREDHPSDLIKYGLIPDIEVNELTPTLAEDLWKQIVEKVG